MIKPNVVIGSQENGRGNVELSCTHVECLDAVLEFLGSIGQTNVVIAESCATDPTLSAFARLEYPSLASRYRVKFLDLNREPFEWMPIWADAHSERSIRISRWLIDPNCFVISAAKLKTHRSVVATLSLKNAVMGAPLVDTERVADAPGWWSEKLKAHGDSDQCLHDNLCRLAAATAPDLAVIDGFDGMEGNGPCWGTPVPHRVALASLDCLAADRVGVESMGIDPAWPAYLNYCHQQGMGQYDLGRIRVLGAELSKFRRAYRMHENIRQQLGLRAEWRG